MKIHKIEFPIFSICILFFFIALAGFVNGSASADNKKNELSSDVSNEYNLQFTPEEKQWLKDHPIVRARVGAAPPLHFFEGTYKGISVDYLNLISRHAGFQVQYVSGIPWPKALAHIKNHEKIDLLLTAKKTEERQKFVAFTDYYLFMPWVIFTRTDSAFVGGMQDLRNKTVSVENGYVMHHKLRDEFPGISLLVVKSSKDAIEAVASGKADAHIGNLTITTYIIQNNNLNNIKVAAPTVFGNHDQAMAVRNDWPELASIINKTLKSLSPEEHANIRHPWLALRYEYGISKDILKWIIAISIFLLIIIGVILFWNRKLKKEVLKRQKNRIDLRTSEEKYRDIFENAIEGFFQSTPEGRFISVNPAFVKMFGYASSEELTSTIFDIEKQYYVNNETRRRYRQIIEKYGFVEQFEFRARCKDGSHIWVSNSTRVIYDQDGKIVRYEGNVTDITERKQAEKQLQFEYSRLMSILDSIPNGVYIVDEHFNIQYINPVIERDFGRIKGRKCYQYFHDRTEVCSWCKNKEVFAGRSVTWEWYSSKTDKHFELFDTPFKNPDGSISKFEIFHDITDRKQAETRIQESEKKYRSMMESMDEAVYICSSDFRVEYMNPAMIKRTGHDASGEPCHKIIHELDEKCPWCAFGKIIKGDSINYEIVSPKDNKTFHISNSPIFHTKGSVSKLTIFRDITEFKKIEARLQQAQKMESIGTLAGGIAHDFNNILFPIIGHTEMLIEDIPEESPFHSSLNEIYTGALRASELVKQILTFSRQESSELKLMKMQPIIKEAFKLIRSSIPTTIEIKQDINPNCGVIKADPTQIHQIVMNLATNAYHAMEEVGGELKVSLKEIEFGEYDVITPEMKPGVYTCLSVTDTGKGMDKELMGKIFDPFFTTKKKGKGTGMGLSVVHGIVKSMGGAIQVYSEPGKGTEFKIYFPVEKSSFDKQSIQIHKTIQGGVERILLIDDEDAIITMEKLMLERLGYQVTSHTISIEALEGFRAAPERFDLVITDMAMPNMPGDKLAVELTKIRPDIPILLCTGFSETMSEEEAASLGIKSFLFKPIVMKDLAQKIRDVLDKRDIETLE